MVSAMAARYRQGHFLNAHNDSAKDEDRAFAYVINLRRGWQQDWGGQMQFLEGGDDIDTFVPYWISLSLFRVPKMRSEGNTYKLRSLMTITYDVFSLKKKN